VPATIGILNGVARVGLDQDELTELAASSAQGKQVIKVSRRDLGYICGLVGLLLFTVLHYR
jgi:pseudouridine-5'-phosphate glycosidase